MKIKTSSTLYNAGWAVTTFAAISAGVLLTGGFTLGTGSTFTFAAALMTLAALGAAAWIFHAVEKRDERAIKSWFGILNQILGVDCDAFDRDVVRVAIASGEIRYSNIDPERWLALTPVHETVRTRTEAHATGWTVFEIGLDSLTLRRALVAKPQPE